MEDVWASIQRTIQDQKERMFEERKMIEEERSRLEGRQLGDSEEVVVLNVGGTIFSTTRETLCQDEDSHLAFMFSGDWKGSFKRDKDGIIFFDFDPELFRLVLSYLRTKNLLQKEIPFPLVPQEKMLEMNAICKFLGLPIEDEADNQNDFEDSIEHSIEDFFQYVAPEVAITENGSVVTHPDEIGHLFALGSRSFSSGEIEWTLKITRLQGNHWIFMGVIGNTSPNNNSYADPTSFGWATFRQVFIKGDNQEEYDGYQGEISEGDQVILTLNCKAKTLSLLIPRVSCTHSIPLSGKKWRLHVNMCGNNDSVELLRVVRK